MNDERPDDLFLPNLGRGVENRDGAFEALEQRYAGLLMALREEARKVCARVGRVTTDDLRAMAKVRGIDDVDPHLWGAIFKELDEAGQPVWKSVGQVKSTIAQNNGRMIRLWVLR